MGLFGKKNKTESSGDSLDIPPPPPISGIADNNAKAPGTIPPPPGLMKEPPLDNSPSIPPPPGINPPPQNEVPQMDPSSNFPPPVGDSMAPPMSESMAPPMGDSMAPPSEAMPPMPPKDAPTWQPDNQLPPESSGGDFDIPPIHDQVDPGALAPSEPGESQPKSFGELFKAPSQAPEEPPMEQSLVEPAIQEDQQAIPPGKQTFVEVGRYRQILKDLTNIRKSLKETDDEISKIIGDINDEEKTFAQLHGTLADVESKLSQLESDFFKG